MLSDGFTFSCERSMSFVFLPKCMLEKEKRNNMSEDFLQFDGKILSLDRVKTTPTLPCDWKSEDLATFLHDAQTNEPSSFNEDGSSVFMQMFSTDADGTIRCADCGRTVAEHPSGNTPVVDHTLEMGGDDLSLGGLIERARRENNVTELDFDALTTWASQNAEIIISDWLNDKRQVADRLLRDSVPDGTNHSRRQSVFAQMASPRHSPVPEELADEVSPIVYSTAEQNIAQEKAQRTGRHAVVAHTAMFCVLMLHTILVPLGVGFVNHPDSLRWGAMEVVEGCVDVLTLLALAGRAKSAFEEEGRLIVSYRAIISRYLFHTGDVVIDIIGLFPLQLFFNSQWHVRVNRLVLLRYLPESSRYALEILLKAVHPSLRTVCVYLMYVIVYWYISIGFIIYVISYNWHDTALWIHRHQWSDFDGPFHVWCTGAEIALRIIFGEHVEYPKSDLQVGMCLVLSMGGIVLDVTLLALAHQIMHSHTDSSTQLSQKLDTVTDELERFRMSKGFISEVHMYYRTMWDHWKTYDQGYADELLSDLPVSLRHRLEYEANVTLISSIPMFRLACESLPESFVRCVARLLQIQMVMPGIPIFRRGDVGEEMYFLLKGEVRIKGSHIFFGGGAYFGESCLLFGGNRPCTVVATSLCHLYVLQKQPFNELIDRFPEALEQLLEGVHQSNQIKSLTPKNLEMPDIEESTQDPNRSTVPDLMTLYESVRNPCRIATTIVSSFQRRRSSDQRRNQNPKNMMNPGDIIDVASDCDSDSDESAPEDEEPLSITVPEIRTGFVDAFMIAVTEVHTPDTLSHTLPNTSATRQKSGDFSRTMIVMKKNTSFMGKRLSMEKAVKDGGPRDF